MPREFRLPSFGSGLKEAQLLAWKVQVGERVTAGQAICDVETEKSVIELPSPFNGIIERLGVEAGGRLRVGEVVVSIRLDSEPALKAQTGGIGSAEVSPVQPPPTATKTPEPAAQAERRVPLSMTRRAIADHLARSWHEIPHVFTHLDVDMSAMLGARTSMSRRGEEKCPLEALLIHAVLPALKEYPQFNSSLDDSDIVFHERLHIGIAVDLPTGLTVPVLRDAGNVSFAELCSTTRALMERATARTLKPEEQTGATFTVNNVGALGSLAGTSIIPYGTAAILSLGRALPRAVVREGSVIVASVAQLSLSFDHRIIDGGHAQRFMSLIQGSISGFTVTT